MTFVLAWGVRKASTGLRHVERFDMLQVMRFQYVLTNWSYTTLGMAKATQAYTKNFRHLVRAKNNACY